MYYLVLDTATDLGFVALYKDEKLIEKSHTAEGEKNSSTLMVQVDNLFNKAEVAPSELSFIGVGVGPGSYTGVRIGAVIAKMLTLSWKVPLVPVCSLIPYFQEGALPAFDARISGVYIYEDGAPKAVALEDLSSEQKISTPHKSLERRLPDHLVVITTPDVDLFAKEALASFKDGKSTSGELEILYLRKTEAEKNL